MIALLLAPFVLQAVAMAFDEAILHRRRGLPRWERIGHPLDSLTVLACYGWLFTQPPSRSHAFGYGALAVFSSLFVTKDEPVHARRCAPAEQWTHALLFLLHPTVLLLAGHFWWTGRMRPLIDVELALTAAFALWQLGYWNGPWARSRAVS